jgi:hypothetical protein
LRNDEEVTELVPREWELRIQKASLFTASAIAGCGNNVSSGKWMTVPCGLVFCLKDGGSRFLPVIASTLTSKMVSHPRKFLYALL